ncbi:hypothetical protein [Nitrobacter sp.]|uniref:hypothetical protein n=1 Tax=Nitrobacter sp. TaxID=29420 RepID=UPI003F64E83E
MSETETPIMPPPDVVHAGGNSLARYRLAFTTLQVFSLREDGRRIEISDGGHDIVFDLDSAQARHLAALLSEPLPRPTNGGAQ